jgi:hypothetical protein
VHDLYAKHIHGGGQAGAGGASEAEVGTVSDADREREFARQRGYLEKNLEGLKAKAEKDAAVHSLDKHKLLRENAILTADINALRCVAPSRCRRVGVHAV